MSLRSCRECHAKISSQAETCPHCGRKNPTQTDSEQFFTRHPITSIVVIGVILLLFALTHNHMDDHNDVAEAKAATTQNVPPPQNETDPLPRPPVENSQLAQPAISPSPPSMTYDPGIIRTLILHDTLAQALVNASIAMSLEQKCNFFGYEIGGANNPATLFGTEVAVQNALRQELRIPSNAPQPDLSNQVALYAYDLTKDAPCNDSNRDMVLQTYSVAHNHR